MTAHALRPQRARVALILVIAACVLAARPAPAQAFSLNPVCDVAGLASGLLGKACSVAQGGAGRVLGAGKQLLGGHIGSAIKTVLGDGASAAKSGATAALGLAAIGAWVLGGAKFVLHEASEALGETTAPHLDSSWFSATYWRVAGIAALLTLPFLFAAAVQALTRSDLMLLLRAALGYLPLAMLAVTVAAPVATLLLSGSDQLSTMVSSAAGQQSAQALGGGIGLAGGLTLLSGSPFFVFFFALLTAAGAMVLWMELLMREAAVYVVVLMLPLAFAALVWPARRVWATRAVELLVALILSKFAIVAVLSLGGAAVDQIGHSITAAVLGLVLVAMAAFSPWVLLRLVPLAEVASSAAATLKGETRGALAHADWAARKADGNEDWASRTVAGMRRAADDAVPPVPPPTTADRAEDSEAAVPTDEDPAVQEMEEPDMDGTGLDPDGAGLDPDGAGLSADDSQLDAMAGSGLEETDGGALVDASAVGGSEQAPDLSAEQPFGPPRPDRRERLPGLPPMWQADDLSWRPLLLGADEGWPPRLWPSDDDAAGAEGSADGPAGLPSAQEPPPTGHEPPSETPAPDDTQREVLALPPAPPPEPPAPEPPPEAPPPEDAA